MRAAVLHLRMASPGLPVVPGNTHPFTADGLAFAHNGFFSPYDALDGLIDPGLLAGAAGSTDSGRFFLRVLTLLRAMGPVDALTRAADDIRGRAAFASLNCLLLTGDALYAYADEDPGFRGQPAARPRLLPAAVPGGRRAGGRGVERGAAA